ncbi:peptidase [Streptosporangium sp. NPDC050855]|uniref:peptidase n=1 Tax=Streptosporangium sp. NPDC050855 TaxID=3366194 RepID=UPI00378F0950
MGLLLCALLTGAGGTTAHSSLTADHVAATTTAMAAAPVRAGVDGPGKGLGIRLLEAPVSRRKDPRALAGVVDHVDPGTVIKRRFEVSNTTGRRLHVFLYAAAADIKDQTFVFAPGRTQNELSSWISVEPAEIDVPAGGARTALFTIRVPKTAWRGERFAEIWAQTEVPPDKEHNVGLATRVGIRVFLDVGPGGERPSNMRIEKLIPERDAAGHPRLLAQVVNTGGRALDISGQLSLTDGPEGIRAGPYPATVSVLLKPGETGRVIIQMGKGLPNGPWKADLTLRSGMIIRTASATITFPDSGTGEVVILLSGEDLLLPVLILLTLALGGAFFLLRRRRRASPDPVAPKDIDASQNGTHHHDDHGVHTGHVGRHRRPAGEGGPVAVHLHDGRRRSADHDRSPSG